MVHERPPRLRLLRWLRGIFLMAQPPLLFEQGNTLGEFIHRKTSLNVFDERLLISRPTGESIDLVATGLPLRLPPGPHSSADDFLSPAVDLVDPPRVGNVLEWVRVEDDEIGALAGGHHSGIDLRDLGGVARRHDYRLGRCEAHGHETFELHLVVPTEAAPGCPVVAAKYELHAGTDELLRNVSRLLCLPTRALDGLRRHRLYRFALLLLDLFARKHLP